MGPVYRAILRLYPANYRAVFAQEMMETFEQAALDSLKRGFATTVCFATRELMGLLRHLFGEWVAKWAAGDRYMNARCVAERETNLPTEVMEMQRGLRRVIGRMEFAIAHHDFPAARRYSDEERTMREQLRRLVSGRERKGASSDQAEGNGCR